MLFGSTKAQTKDADPADVASIDSIIKAVYDVISGEAGKKRDWARFNSLFYKNARLIPTGKNAQTGVVGANAVSPEDYVKRAEPVFERDGFFEREIAGRREVFGNIAHVFSTYEARRKAGEEKPFMRGINSFQLMNDGKRWWIMTIFWQAESPEIQIPKKYMKSKK
jgi:hypothetical protein